MDKLKFLTTQFAIKFKKPMMNPEGLLSLLGRLPMGSIFDDSPEINPVPFIPNDKELLDVHVVKASSTDHTYELKIARGRLDFFRNFKEGENGYDDTHDDFYSKVKMICSALDKYAVEIEWIGFVNTYILKLDATTLSESIFNSDLVSINEGQPNTYFMRHANRLSVGEILSNNELTLSTGTVNIGNQEKIEGLIIKQDFNTKPSTNLINNVFIETYLNEAKQMIKVEKIVDIVT